jgi:hypothetical protein
MVLLPLSTLELERPPLLEPLPSARISTDDYAVVFQR